MASNLRDVKTWKIGVGKVDGVGDEFSDFAEAGSADDADFGGFVGWFSTYFFLDSHFPKSIGWYEIE